MKNKTRRIIKKTSKSIGIVFLVFLLTVSGYFAYVISSYSRIENNLILEVKQNSEIKTIEINKELSITSFNVGYGAYSPSYSFFLSKGYDEYGNKIKGKYAKGFSKEEVLKNINNSIDVIKKLNSDFYALQEVDLSSNRAYHINQKKLFEDIYSNYSSTYCENYNSAYLLYPFNDPIGKSRSGMVTLSKYQLNDNTRHSLTISNNFDKFFDLDRCFSSHYINVDNGKKLCLINIHMSAYDKGGKIRNKQVNEIKEVINNEYNNGNYVIVAGDFNHDLLTNNPMYNYNNENRCFSSIYKQKVPDFVSNIFDENKKSPFGDNFKIYADDRNPSMRSGDSGYKENYTYINTFDGFVVSDNIEFIEVKTTNLKNDEVDRFSCSDHQPTTLKFKLK